MLVILVFESPELGLLLLPPGHFGPALWVICLGLDLSRALFLLTWLLVVGGGGGCCCGCCFRCLRLVFFFGGGQNLAIWPTYLHPQHLGRSLLTKVSGMAWKPSLVRHSRNI